MAKNKKEITVTETVKGASLDTFNKQWKNVIFDANFIVDTPKQVIPVSPQLDIGLNGGIPEGCWALFSGKPKCGKTTTALQFCANAQKEENGNRHIYYIDVEGRLKKLNLTGVHDLNHNKITVIRSSAERILTGEDFLNCVDNIVRSTQKSIILVDSISALCANSESVNDISGRSMPTSPRAIAQFCRKMATIVPIQDNILICILHLISNMSGYGGPKEDGGVKLQYQADVKLRCMSVDTWEDGRGQTPNWSVDYSALGPPGRKIKSHIRYGFGIDETLELIDIGIDFGLITLGGSWYTCDFMKDTPKFQGKENLHEYLSTNTEAIDILNNNIREMMS